MTRNTHRAVMTILAINAVSEHISCFIYPPKLPPQSCSKTLLFASTDTETLKEGRLVEFSSGAGANKQMTLGAIIGKDGKRNLKILTSSGRTSSIPPRSIKHIVPNARSISEESQIERHESAAAAALEDDMATGGQSIAEVWEMLLEDDDEAVNLATLSELIRGDSTSVSCY